MEIVDVAMIVIDDMTNTKAGTYLDYIINLHENGTLGGRMCKETDMEVNYADTDGIPSPGQRKGLKTKYSLAYYILTGRKIEEAPTYAV